MSKVGGNYALFAALCILAALSVRTPAVHAGLLADDWDHYAMSAGIYPVPRSAFDHFDFIGRSSSEHRAFQLQGRLPWWSAPNLHVALFRPLASLLGELDFAWLDGYRHPSRAHIHSLLWWLALVVGVAFLLARLLPLPAAAIGALLYAIDDAHIVPASWIANRSELVANALVVWALYLAVRAAQTVRRPLGLEVLSLSLAAAALLAGEHAIPALAFLFAFQLLRVELEWRKRMLRVAPVLGLVVAYLVVRRLLGYGASGHGLYVEPFLDVARYLRACIAHLPLLFGDLVLGFAADWHLWGPPPGSLFARLPMPEGTSWASVQVAVGWVSAVLFAAAVAWLARAAEDPTKRSLLWLLLGAAASLLPMCATVPMGRLTLPAAIGVDAALAFGIYELARRAWRARRAVQFIPVAAFALLVLSCHLVSPGIRAYREAQGYADLSKVEERWARLDGLDIRGRDVVILTAGCTAQWVIPYIRHRHGLTVPRSSTPLSAAFLSPHEVVRSAANTLELRLPGRPIGATILGSVYRSDDHVFHAGDHIPTPNFDVTVLATDRGEPTWLRFTFPVALDDPRYLFLFARPAGLQPLELPPIGERISLPIPAWPTAPPQP